MADTLIILSRGKKLIDLPYTVKGMDVSFSGILSYIEVSLLFSSSIQSVYQHFLLKGENLSKQGMDKNRTGLFCYLLSLQQSVRICSMLYF